jgi:hypothetical protein
MDSIFCDIVTLLFIVCMMEAIILPVVLYGCETWSLTLREEHRLRVFENGAEENICTEEG